MRAGRNHRVGFSIIELVVVIGVIMVLMGLLLPVLGGAKATAMQMRQVSNIRQVGMLIDLYLNDWDDTYPLADIRPDWHPTSVSRKTAAALGIGRYWAMPLIDSGLVTRKQFQSIYWDSYAFGSVTMYTDPELMLPDSIPAWETFTNSPVRRYWAKYPSDKGLVGVSFVPDARGNDKLIPGYTLWHSMLPEGPRAPVLFADSSVLQIQHDELLEPDPAPIDVWGSGIMYTWHGIRGRDK
ncbi:MAG TPA: type II secretion system protein [Phycisphaerales bacterium]|nr:type II secretion system protein [Phycisphaerales bacterium]